MDISFFFKQKTAYEMRMSDCSSDVCSSDRAVQDRAPDIFRAVAVIGTRHALEHTGLALDIGSHGIGLGDAERDLAGGERLDHGSRQFGEPNALLDEPGGDTESLGENPRGPPAYDNVFDTNPIRDRESVG